MSAPTMPRRRHAVESIPAHRRLRVPMDLTRVRRRLSARAALYWGGLGLIWASYFIAVAVEAANHF